MRRKMKFGVYSGNSIKKCPTCDFDLSDLVSGMYDQKAGCLPGDSEEVRLKKLRTIMHNHLLGHKFVGKRKVMFNNKNHKHNYELIWKKEQKMNLINAGISIHLEETNTILRLFKLKNPNDTLSNLMES